MTEHRQEGFEGQLLFHFTPGEIENARNDAVQKFLHATDIGYYPHAQGHYVDRPSGSANHILIHCIAGKGWFRIAEEEYTVYEGEFFVIPAGIPHQYGSEKQWSIFWLHVEGEIADSFIQKISNSRGYTPRPEPDRELTVDLFRDLLKRLSASFSSSTISYVNYSLGHLLGIYCLHETLSADGRQGDQSMHDVISFMKEHLADNLTLREMSEYADLSVSRFSELFRELTGYSPVDYYIRLRIQRAAQLLTSTSYKIKNIALFCGWENPFYFSRSFRKATGYSPKEYRELFYI